MTDAIREGLSERKVEKDVVEADEEDEAPKRSRRKMKARIAEGHDDEADQDND
jgi:hypothetical protein